MQVEAIAWISARETLLLCFHSLIAIISYIKYLQYNHSNKWLTVSILFFLLALLSSTVAIALPIVLLLIDFIYQRKDFRNMVLSKQLFFLLSVFFLYIGIKAFTAINIDLAPNNFNYMESVFITSFNMIVHVIKVIVPYNLSPLHKFDSIEWYYYASILPLILGLYYGLKSIRKTGNWQQYAFGFLFFFTVLLPSTPLFQLKGNIGSEQFSYFPNIGLFFVVSFLLKRLFSLNIYVNKIVINIFLISFFFLLCLTSNNQSKVWESGDTLWVKAASIYPKDYRNWALRGDYWLQQGNNKNGELYFSKACHLKNDFYTGFQQRAICFMHLGDKTYNKEGKLGMDYYRLAMNDLNIAVNGQANPDSYYYRGLILNKIGETKKAIIEFNKALLDIVDGRYYLERGRARSINYNFNGAIKDFELAIKHGIDSNMIKKDVAFAEAQKINLVPVKNDFNNCLEKNPRDVSCLLDKGLFQLSEHNYLEALTTFNLLIDIDSNAIVAQINAGLCKLNMNDSKNSILNFSKALKIDSINQEALLNRSIAYRYSKKHVLALQDIQKAIRLNNSSFMNYKERVNIYVAMDKKLEAIKECDRLISLNPGFPKLYIMRAEVLEHYGNTEKAQQDRQKAENLN